MAWHTVINRQLASPAISKIRKFLRRAKAKREFEAMKPVDGSELYIVFDKKDPTK